MTGYRGNEKHSLLNALNSLENYGKCANDVQWSFSFSSNMNDSQWQKPGPQEVLHQALVNKQKLLLKSNFQHHHPHNESNLQEQSQFLNLYKTNH